ncbi:MAG: Fur family transcriptional regulator [Chloroflexi bacterium]|nr:Fur family transcriptional regulator [Chloroflexota bacterium]
MITPKKAALLLKQKGYKLTSQRYAVLKVIDESHDHLTPADIYEKVHHENSSIGLVTIYRTLDILTHLGLICEVHAGGNCRSYLLRRESAHHHHLVCSDCGKVVDFTSCDLAEIEKKLSQQTGFKISSHLLEFLGRCTNCQTQKTKQ